MLFRSYESIYGLDPKDIYDSLEDSDNDGYSNLLEYLYGSGVANPNSKPSFKRVGDGTEAVTLKTTVIGRNGRGVIADGYYYTYQNRVVTNVASLTTVGHPVPKETNRSFIHFDLSSLSGIKTIESAKLVITFRHYPDTHKYGKYPDEILFGALNKAIPPHGEYPDTDLKTFEIVKGTESIGRIDSFFNTDKVEEAFDITPAVKYWVEQNGENCGLMFMYKEELKYWRERKWYNRLQDGGGVSPRIEVSHPVKEIVRHPNRIPVITRRSPDGKTNARVGEPLRFEIAAEDPDGDNEKLRYEWFASASMDLLKAEPSSIGPVFNFNGYSHPGIYLVVVRITDAVGDYTVDGFYVVVQAAD